MYPLSKNAFPKNIITDPIKRKTEIKLKACILHQTKTDVTPLAR
ncbi:peptidase M23 [Bacillus thuringiensis]|nr:peptidase M23 [Bacillus thuringiensis]